MIFRSKKRDRKEKIARIRTKMCDEYCAYLDKATFCAAVIDDEDVLELIFDKLDDKCNHCPLKEL